MSYRSKKSDELRVGCILADLNGQNLAVFWRRKSFKMPSASSARAGNHLKQEPFEIHIRIIRWPPVIQGLQPEIAAEPVGYWNSLADTMMVWEKSSNLPRDVPTWLFSWTIWLWFMKLVRFWGPFSQNHKSSQTSRKTSREKSRKVPVVEYRGFNIFQPFCFPRKYQSILDGRATVISVISISYLAYARCLRQRPSCRAPKFSSPNAVWRSIAAQNSWLFRWALRGGLWWWDSGCLQAT